MEGRDWGVEFSVVGLTKARKTRGFDGGRHGQGLILA